MGTTHSTTRLATTAALAALACAMTACAGSSSSSPTTTGKGGTSAEAASAAEPLVLRLGTNDRETRPGALQVKHFAEEVAERSDGAVRIEPVWQVDDGQPHWDQAVAKKVFDGDLEMAMIPSRAWDDLGVSSLTALTAPFLVTTDTLVADIVADRDLVEEIVSGLPAVGITALGLYPEALRHPFGVPSPLLGAEDYAGGVFRVAWSRSGNAMYGSLGATTSDAAFDPTTMIGSEASYVPAGAGTATGNVVFYPKVNVLSIDADVEAGLDDEQRAVLRAAADATAAWVRDTRPTDGESALAYCEQAGKIAAASPAELASLIAATRPVVEQLREDATTAKLIDAISAMAKDDPAPERVTSCPKPEVDEASELDGTYTFTVTEEAVRAAGGSDQDKIDNNTGDLTVTFEDGTWLMDQVFAQGPDAGTTWHGTGGFTFDGDHFEFFWAQDPGAWTKADIEIRADGDLVFSNVVDGGGPEEQALSEVWFRTWQRQDG